jgi:hypothetical protein
MDAHKLRSYYRDHLSGFHRWNQKRHASDWVLFGDNLGDHLAIDETSLIISEIERISVVAGVWHHVASHHHIGGIVARVWHSLFRYKRSK